MFEGISSLRGAGEKIAMTSYELNEYIKCSEDILYFAENYYFIQTIDEGRIKIPLWDFQKKLLKVLMDPSPKRHVVVLSARQMSKTTVASIFLLHYALFSKEANVAILANNERTAREILARIQMAYQNLPLWLQQGIVIGGWNKSTLHLENGIKVIASSTSSNSIRGMTLNLVFLDEAAFIPDHIWEDFFNSVLPAISAGKTSKIVMVSTPKGMNHFYDIYKKAVDNTNNFKPVKIPWYERPDRDEEWKKNTLRDTGAIRFAQEFDCKFLGSSNTLVEGDMLERISTAEPIEIKYSGAFLVYEQPIPGAFYILGVDSAKGGGGDYSVVNVIKINNDNDVDQVAVYRCNTIDTDNFSQVCIGISNFYNNAYMMVENNDVGAMVAETIWYEYECDRIINVDPKGLGVRSTRKTKLAGNLLLKKYVENGWLQINDARTLYELSRYEEVSPNVFHAASVNDNDDCVTSLIWALYYLTTPFYDRMGNSINKKEIDRKYNIEEPESYEDSGPIFMKGDDIDQWM